MSEARDEYYKEQWNREKSDLYISELEEQNEEMLDALIYFVKRVREGSIKSKTTYLKYVAIIEKITGSKIEEVVK